MTARIIENPAWRNREGVYADRHEAGRIVASYLEPYSCAEAIVLGIPAGGVPVGLEIARCLMAAFDMLIIRKIPIPGNTEAGFGAVSIEGDLVLNESLVRQLGLSREDIVRLTAPVKKQIAQRNSLFRSGRLFPSLTGKTVITTDDGLASGYTMGAAVEVVRRKKPQSAIIAVPTAPLQTIERLQNAADLIICPNIREGYYFAVASAYREWHDLSNEEVLALLNAECGII